ncbi:MAG: D-Ala-D-Ala carboxypeptidase family metallohydrolase [Caulobacter sp.]|nr:D-Ala-D-Ala carboxypeptidase family metallohydrolase [Caulobacter sp.]
MTPLSAHFTLEEMTHSNTAARRGLDNTPTGEALANLRVTASRMEAVREVLGGRVITVNSGYRAPAVNAAVGGSATSGHMDGWAVDFNCWSFGDPLAVCRAIVAGGIKFDQLLQEGTWVHISFDPRMRGQVKTKGADGKLRPGL